MDAKDMEGGVRPRERESVCHDVRQFAFGL